MSGRYDLRFEVALLPIGFIILAGSVLAACGEVARPSPTTAAKAPVISSAAPGSRGGWEEKWNTVLSEAKKEGTVAIYSDWGPRTRLALSQPFKERYGINLEFSPFGRVAELTAKVQAETRAGLYLADFFGAGSSALVGDMKPEGILGPIQPLLILPEVLDSKPWTGGKLPFADKEGLALALISAVMRTNLYNTDQIKEGEISSYKDLLKPQYKGKITLGDPSTSGAGNSLVSHLGHNLWGEAETIDFLRRLLKEQQAVVQRDKRILVESVARGKFAFGLAPSIEPLAEFVALGAPIKSTLVKEDNRVTASTGGMGVPTRFAHPNAAIIFVNWLLTREGQSIFARTFGNPSSRLDASIEGIDPVYIPTPGEKYHVETEEFLAARGRWAEIARKIMEETSR